MGTSHSAMSIGLRKDYDKYLRERLCKIPPAPPTSVIIKEITESSVDSGHQLQRMEKPCQPLKALLL